MKPVNHVILVILAITLSVGVFVYDVIPQCGTHPENCFGPVQVDLTGSTLPAPFRFRILNRILLGTVADTPTDAHLLYASLVIHTLCFAVIYSGLYLWLRRWGGSEVNAVVGVFIFVAFLPLAIHIYSLNIASILEVALVIWALLFMNRFRVVIILLIIATFNRETAILIPLAYMACNPRKWQRSAILVLIYAVITAVLHLWLGAAPHQLGFAGTIAYNENTISNAIFVNLMIAPLCVLTIINYRRAPDDLKRLCWVAALYVVSVIIGAAWEEVRLQMVILPLILPVIIRALPSETKKLSTIIT